MICCCGEALIDMLPRTSEAGEPTFAPYPGGAVFNTAIALGRLGAPVEFFTGLSSDLFGQMLEQALRASGVDARPCHVSDRPTTLAFVTLTDGHAKYAFYDENTAGRMLAIDDLPDLGAEVSALFFGGISLVADPCGATYEALLRREAGRRLIMLDPNIRPGFITDETAYRARLDRMLAQSDVVKMSDEDLRWLLGEADLNDLAGQVLSMGVKVLCLTEGAKGATAYTPSGKVSVPAPSVAVVDTVGAGDTFNAGFLAGLQDQGLLTKQAVASLSEDALEHALSLAIRAAAVTVRRAGANPPWRSEL